VGKAADRWIIVDPEGHPFWMLAVDAIDWNMGGKVGLEAAKARYGEKGLGPKFAEHAAHRLRSWGFNTIGVHSHASVLPVPMYGAPNGCPVRVPFIRSSMTSFLCTINRNDVLPEPVKVLVSGALDPKVYRGWPGHFPDVFDPKFAEAAKRYAGEVYSPPYKPNFTKNSKTGGVPHPSLADEPWMLATMLDESDTLFGFGPGTELPGIDGNIHTHLGWVVAATKPTQTANDRVASIYGAHQFQYSDTTVYSKLAWRDYLKEKYGNIDTLNRAWGSHYTTFESDGGWPEGHGLLDESGRNPWIGNDSERLSTARFPVRADLDAFLGILAERYYKVAAEGVRAATPHHLILTNTNNHGGLVRREILRAAGKYCDLIELNFPTERPEIARITYEETHRPLVGFIYFTANKDSQFYASPRTSMFDFPTQEKRAEAYRKQLDFLYGFQAADGTHPIVGMEFFAYMDSWGEKANFGLVSLRHNAYDGKEAVTAGGTDAWGYSTGSEERNYGDFITRARQANSAVLERMQQELSRR
jgi:hypothetical protein